MKEYLNILEGEIDLALVALNPTETAIKNKSVFSRDRTFWNILENANIISGSENVDLKELANQVFRLGIHSNIKLGFADLVPYVVETDSKKIKPIGDDVSYLSIKLAYHKTKKVALMGRKVVDAFSKKYPSLPRWQKIPKIDNRIKFGFIGEVTIEDHIMKIYAMPFPGTSNIINKHEAFKKLL